MGIDREIILSTDLRQVQQLNFANFILYILYTSLIGLFTRNSKLFPRGNSRSEKDFAHVFTRNKVVPATQNIYWTSASLPVSVASHIKRSAL